MKLIELANRSDFGWKITSEYEQDDLVFDSDDEKLAQRSGPAAERTVKGKT